MKIAIIGTGIAGPALAWWLRHYGHEPVLFEKSPQLRTGGYMIDFWGVGYTVAEKMGLLPELEEQAYFMRALRFVNARGRRVAGFQVDNIRKALHDRFFSISRSDIAATLYRASGVEALFGTTVTRLTEHSKGVTVHLSNGTHEEFDLVAGADGLHSRVRGLAFGPQLEFEKRLGYYVAAFTLPDYLPRDELVYVSHTAPGKQVARVAMRQGRTLFLFIYRADLLSPALPRATRSAAAAPLATADVPPTDDTDPSDADSQKAALHRVFGDMTWEVPRILSRMDMAEDFYFDRVSQIHMEKWSTGRVVLLGDAAACVSFLAGEGTGLALTEAYILAGELHAAGRNYRKAFENYEARLRPLLRQKQTSALKLAGFFAPRNNWRMHLRDMAVNAASIPLVAKWLMRRSFKDDFVLPEYGGRAAEVKSSEVGS